MRQTGHMPVSNGAVIVGFTGCVKVGISCPFQIISHMISFVMFVVDANIVLAGLRSRNGASFQILSHMIDGSLQFALSTPIALEYEDLLKRAETRNVLNWMKDEDLDLLLDTLIQQSILVTPWFRYRPFLEDPKDDIYIECAMAVGSSQLVSFDKGFRNPDVKAFGIELVSPKQALEKL